MYAAKNTNIILEILRCTYVREISCFSSPEYEKPTYLHNTRGGGAHGGHTANAPTQIYTRAAELRNSTKHFNNTKHKLTNTACI